jgi:hypothetical protein
VTTTPTTEEEITGKTEEEHIHKGNQGITKNKGRTTMATNIDMRRIQGKDKNQKGILTILMRKKKWSNQMMRN